MTTNVPTSPAAWLAPMIPLWNQQMLLGSEAAMVIARRMWLVALADPRAAAESQRMVAEKVETLAKVWWDMALAPSRALLGGKAMPTAHGEARRAVQTYRRKVRANLRRLGPV
ncbi:hypothetical protein [Novosphingobium sp. SG720]|uniref:hypothetical protein n=1 Tax=Novosphingobium sp. SG720 TaxID=2586998 RepID=UPI001834459F|nr:hypothetical protein [Novosphingobium sp. SG720]NKJ43332.1 hypothetical protein [Novosphingobium sp. SG720]